MLPIFFVALATLLCYAYWLVKRRREESAQAWAQLPLVAPLSHLGADLAADGASSALAPPPPAGGLGTSGADTQPEPFTLIRDRQPAPVEKVLGGISVPPELSLITHLADGERRGVDSPHSENRRVVFLVTTAWESASRAMGEAIARTGTSVEWVTPTEAVLARSGAQAVMVVYPDAATTMIAAKQRMFPSAPAGAAVIEVRSA